MIGGLAENQRLEIVAKHELPLTSCLVDAVKVRVEEVEASRKDACLCDNRLKKSWRMMK
jgi:hypothetical protein